MSKKLNKLSHSAASRYQDCPKSYEYHYIHRIRSKVQSAALLFGTAVDRGIGKILEPSGSHATEAKDAFEYAWRFQEVNGKNTYLPKCIDIAYANSDFDVELLLPEDWDKLRADYGHLMGADETPQQVVDGIYERKESVGFERLPEIERTILNHANWLCLRRKGLYMLKAVETQVLPNITEVLGTQVYVTLENSAGDKVIGYADLVCRWRGYDKPVVIDFKTSSREYAKDSVLTSPQLTLYVHSLYEQYQTRLAGFVVLSKHLRKNRTKICSVCGNDGTGKRHKTCDNEITGAHGRARCNGAWNETLAPEALVDVIISEIPERTEDIVLQNLDDINTMLKQGMFTRNFSSCIKPWGRCPYFDKCYKDSDEGLIQLEFKDGSKSSP